MASTCLTVLLVATLPLVPTGASSNPVACSFPFTYKNRVHATCITEDAGGRFWCATTPSYDTDRAWKYCTLKEHGGNSEGRPCVFPFKFLEQTRHGCVREDNHPRAAWCATTDDYNRDRLWSFCPDIMLGGNSEDACVFPFEYRQKTYSECIISKAGGRTWCATTANYDRDRLWRYCGTHVEGNEKAPCIFPYKYGNRDFFECIGGNPWCATSRHYDTDQRWRYCYKQAYGGSSKGQPCVFPFRYEGRVQVTCPRDEEGVYWCATTSDYDRDRLWSYCPDTPPGGNNPTGPCVFPFLYGGKNYTSCIQAGDGKLWCATTSNYDRDRKRKDCSVRAHGGSSGGKSCVIPFQYQGKTYHSCTNQNSPASYWCSTTEDYGRDGLWSYCADTAVGGTQPGAPCVFPFTYRNGTHHSCTTAGEEGGRPWCSTTDNYPRDRKWTYCQLSGPRN